MARSKPIKPEFGFGAAGERLWAEVTGSYELSPGEVEILRQACDVADVISFLHDALIMDGRLLVRGSAGQDKANPLIVQAADQRRLLDQLMRSLALPMPGEVEGHRRSPEQVRAAQARWRREKARRGALAANS